MGCPLPAAVAVAGRHIYMHACQSRVVYTNITTISVRSPIDLKEGD